MPTYRNDTMNTYHVYDIDGHPQRVAPTESIETYKILGTGWTKTADTPVKVTSSRVFLVGATTGTWQEIILPPDIVAKSVLVQIHNGVASDFSSFAANPPTFHYSTTGSSGQDFIQCVGSFSIDIFDGSSPSIGFVRAATNNYVVVTVLA